MKQPIEKAKSARTIALAFMNQNNMPTVLELEDTLGAKVTIDLEATNTSEQALKQLKPMVACVTSAY